MHINGGVVIENNGLGYQLFVPENSSIYLAKEGETVFAFTAMIVREDDISLYGFGDEESLSMFNKLMTISGVGAKAALAVLASMPLDEIKKAIIFDDPTTLTKANGIGKKTAQRIVLELKDKIGAIAGFDENSEIVDSVFSTSEKSEAANALITLGYTKSEAVSALANIKNTDLTAEEYIKLALKRLF
jgi:Holliday junction DNA helicase RuvA